MLSPLTTQLRRWLSALGGDESSSTAVALTPSSLVGAATYRHKVHFLVRQKHAAFGLFVLLPTLLTAFYLFVIAADQYESEAHFFIVNESSNESSNSNSSSGGGALSGSSASASQAATLAVVDYLKSHDAIRDAEQSLDLVGIYRRPESDWLARVRSNPSPEKLYKYLYGLREMIAAYVDISEGVAVLKVHAFRPDDAQNVAKALLSGADRLVDRFGQRMGEDTLRVARAEVDRSEARVVAMQQKVTAFRLAQQSVDPGKSADTVLDVVGKLEDQLSQAQADLVTAQAYLKPDSPRFAVFRNRVDALQAQITSEKARLTGADGSLTPTLGAYGKLMQEEDFAEKDYQSALAALEEARIEADRQHMYLVQVVEPNLPQDSEFPEEWFDVLSVFVTLSVCYGIGWLIVAGVREHGG